MAQVRIVGCCGGVVAATGSRKLGGSSGAKLGVLSKECGARQKNVCLALAYEIELLDTLGAALQARGVLRRSKERVCQRQSPTRCRIQVVDSHQEWSWGAIQTSNTKERRQMRPRKTRTDTVPSHSRGLAA